MAIKFFKATFVSKKTVHPQGEKTIVLYVADSKKGVATDMVKETLAMPTYEGENAQFFKNPVMDEISKEEYDAAMSGDDFEDQDFDDFEESEIEVTTEESEDQEGDEPASIDDIDMIAYATCLFGYKKEYTEEELEKISDAMAGDVTAEEQQAIDLVIKISNSVVSEHIDNLTFGDLTQIVAHIDSAGLKSKQNESVMYEAGARYANEKSIKARGDKLSSVVNEKLGEIFKEKKEEKPQINVSRVEVIKVPVTAPFELFVKTKAVDGGYVVSFLTGCDGVKSAGDLDEFNAKVFKAKENAYTFGCGGAIDWFLKIEKGEGHLSDAAKSSIDSIKRVLSTGDKLGKVLSNLAISGGVDLAEAETEEDFDDSEDFDFDDFDDFDFDDSEDFEEEPELEEKSVKEENQIDVEECIQSQDSSEITLEQINEIVNNLKPGETFGMADVPEGIYRASDGMANSSLKMFREDAAALEWIKSCPVDEEKIKPSNIGRAVHTAMGEPELYNELYVTAPSVGNMPQSAQIDKYNEWVANGRPDDKTAPTPVTIEKMDVLSGFESEVKDRGLTVLSKEDQKKIDLMVGSMKAHPTIQKIMDLMVYSEYSIWWISPKSGVLCKCRVDWVCQDDDGKFWPIDVKTTGDFDNFGKSVSEFEYDYQEAHYMEGFQMHFGKDAETLKNMLFVVVSSSIMCGRYKCGVKDIPKEWVEEAREHIDCALIDYKQRCEDGDFITINTVSYKWRNK